MTVHMTIDSKRFNKRMGKIMSNMENRRSLYAQAVVIADKWIQDNFKFEGALAQEGGWKPLKAATLARRRKGKGKGSPKILQDTGQLKSRWKHQWTARFGKIQSGVIYGTTHHEGYKPLKIPARPILPTEEQLMPKLIKLAELWVNGAFRK